jgi:hypothetical protein
MSAAARSFIRADSSDPHAGWAGSSSSNERMAALLCFDEMQVSDLLPFLCVTCVVISGARCVYA